MLTLKWRRWRSIYSLGRSGGEKGVHGPRARVAARTQAGTSGLDRRFRESEVLGRIRQGSGLGRKSARLVSPVVEEAGRSGVRRFQARDQKFKAFHKLVLASSSFLKVRYID